jgi:hypothetical protein
MAKMGLQFGLEKTDACYKRTNRWLFTVPEVCGDDTPKGVNSLPPTRAARPSLSFKEIEVRHLNEDVFFPGKPDWKPITLTLYDLKVRSAHPVFKWLRQAYEPEIGKFYEPLAKDLFKECRLELYDGCGKNLETWIYEDAWPQAVNFQTLDMSQSMVLTCEITLRYARSYMLGLVS